MVNDPFHFPEITECDIEATENDSVHGLAHFDSGAVRSNDADNCRFDLITPIGLQRLAETCHEGAVKYDDHNWEKGMPASTFANHAIRHVYLWLSGDNSEDHLAHAAWNLLAIMHFEELKPELIDIPNRKDKEIRTWSIPERDRTKQTR